MDRGEMPVVWRAVILRGIWRSLYGDI